MFELVKRRPVCEVENLLDWIQDAEQTRCDDVVAVLPGTAEGGRRAYVEVVVGHPPDPSALGRQEALKRSTASARGGEAFVDRELDDLGTRRELVGEAVAHAGDVAPLDVGLGRCQLGTDSFHRFADLQESHGDGVDGVGAAHSGSKSFAARERTRLRRGGGAR
jgi:hypothetical protein